MSATSPSFRRAQRSRKRSRSLTRALVLCLLAASSPASAATKAYVREQGASPGELNLIVRAPSVSPSVRCDPSSAHGEFFLEDNNLGTVTLNGIRFGEDIDATYYTTGFMGAPRGSYVYIRNRNTLTATPGQSAPGSAHPGGSIDWGVVSGWSTTGFTFCRSAPPIVCTFNGVVEGGTALPELSSTTFDLGTWVFDGNGSFDATPYISNTHNGGIGNTSIVLRGVPFGASLPTLPLVGVAALGTSLVILGIRGVRSRVRPGGE